MQTPIKHIRIPDELWNALERIGKEDDVDRTAGWLVRKAIEEFIERHRAAKRAAKAAEPAKDADPKQGF
jgi:predicted transcriptional regulator